MSEAEQALNNGLDLVFTGITAFIQQLRVITLQPDFEATYRVPTYGRANQIRGLLAWFDGISRSKREAIRRMHIQQRDHTTSFESNRLIETLNRDNFNNTLQMALKNCFYYDRDLFDASTDNPHPQPRPPEWVAFMQTAHELKAEEERFFQLTRTYPKAWYQIQWNEESEDWSQYDFVIDKSLLGNVNALLVQLKLLT
jgi:hypothetical protein